MVEDMVKAKSDLIRSVYIPTTCFLDPSFRLFLGTKLYKKVIFFTRRRGYSARGLKSDHLVPHLHPAMGDPMNERDAIVASFVSCSSPLPLSQHSTRTPMQRVLLEAYLYCSRFSVVLEEEQVL
jgi:hypothetical protein